MRGFFDGGDDTSIAEGGRLDDRDSCMAFAALNATQDKTRNKWVFNNIARMLSEWDAGESLKKAVIAVTCNSSGLDDICGGLKARDVKLISLV